MSEEQRVWVAFADGGSYSSSWWDLVGVFKTREAGQRAARVLLEARLEKIRAEIAAHAEIADGLAPFPPGYTKHWTEEQWRANFRSWVVRKQGIVDRLTGVLELPWSEGEDGAVSISIDEDEWQFTVTPYEVEG